MSSRIRSYGTAVLATGIACLADVLLQERLTESSGSLYVAAALVSTWFGGLGPGLAAIGLTIGLNLAFFDDPDLSMAVGVHGFERLILFSVVALVVNLLAARVRRRTAALNESNRQLEAFCYTLAHDLRAPLRAIQGFADILLAENSSKLDENGRAGVERIRNSAERMGRLILDLLAYTNLSRGDFQKKAVDLNAICQKVLRMFADEIRRTGARVSVELPAQCVIGDSVGVERVLVNLLANALRFSSPGRPPEIGIVSEKRGPKVRVSVSDNGVGIDPRYQDRIFGVFERLAPGGNQVGTGIGLAIVKRSLEKMGGTVGVESAPGAGSRFWFELPEAAQKQPLAARELVAHEQV